MLRVAVLPIRAVGKHDIGSELAQVIGNQSHKCLQGCVNPAGNTADFHTRVDKWQEHHLANTEDGRCLAYLALTVEPQMLKI